MVENVRILHTHILFSITVAVQEESNKEAVNKLPPTYSAVA